MKRVSHRLKAVIWKNIILRKRNWILFIIEILCPFLLFVCIVLLRNIGKEINYKEFKGHEMNSSELAALGFKKRRSVDILFAPINDFTIKLMKKVNESLQSHNLRRNGSNKKNNNIVIDSFIGFETETLMDSKLAEMYYNKHSSLMAKIIGFGIVFDSMNNTLIIPKQLHYKIRSSNHIIRTDLKFDAFIAAGRAEGKAGYYIRSGLTSLQLALDRAYIEMVTGKPLPFEILVREFPFPAYKEISSIKMESLITAILPTVTMLSFIFLWPSLIKNIVEEKSSGIKELMKMVGLNKWILWLGWLLNGLFVYIIVSALITACLKIPFSPDIGSLFATVDSSIMFVTFILFSLSAIIFGFAISSFFNNAIMAMCFGMIVWIISFVTLTMFIVDQTANFFIKLSLSVIPVVGINLALYVMTVFDTRGVPLNWGSLFTNALGNRGESLGYVLVMFLFDIFFWGLVTWYVESVKPGPYGRARPWYFIFMCWAKDKDIRQTIGDMDIKYEAPPPGLTVGIGIHKLRKVFGTNVVAIDRVDLDIYQNQITVLLGHNGAGKSTMLSILTGMFSPTSGSVMVDGNDIFNDLSNFRINLGFCPQSSVLFTYLTVLEHLIFFGMVKGLTKNQAKEDGLNILRLFSLENKMSSVKSELSGGMLRKVALALALIGNPKILMLDEPTSGMDLESRREIWDLLLTLRGNRTILITTQFMEEADILGDWIAIMDHGIVSCYGTCAFLKRVYGTGYYLTISKEPNSRESNITKMILSFIPTAEKTSDLNNQMVYSLPLETASEFPRMFTTLERKRFILGITGISISCTTIEEVFLKVGEMADGFKPKETKSLDNSQLSKYQKDLQKIRGLNLMSQQFKTFLYKKILFTLRKWWLTFFFMIPAVVLLVMCVPRQLTYVHTEDLPELDVNLQMYGKTLVFLAFNNSEDTMKNIYSELVQHQTGTVQEVQNINKVAMKRANENMGKYRVNTIVSAEFTNTRAIAYFNNIPFHSVPISLNLVTNTLLKSLTESKTYSIFISYQPINMKYVGDPCVQFHMQLGENVGQMWGVAVPQGLLFFMSGFIYYPLIERISKTKQLQLMTGALPLYYWLSCFILDFISYIVVLVGMVVALIISDVNSLYINPYDIMIFLLVHVFYGISGTFFAYCFSYWGESASTSVSIYLIFNIIFGLIASMMVLHAFKLSQLIGGKMPIPNTILPLVKYVLPLNPHYCLNYITIVFADTVYQNTLCRRCHNGTSCPVNLMLRHRSNINTSGILTYIQYLALDWVLYLVLILIADCGFFIKLYWWFWNLILATEDLNVVVDKQNNAVRREKEKVIVTRNFSRIDPKIVLVADGLSKKFNRKSIAVQNVTFRVLKGECFGILGVNGAGKTTLFKMLTFDEIPTIGDAKILDCDLYRHHSKYLSQIGYCPQYDGVNYVYTGNELLNVFANLRGIHPSLIQEEVNKWIEKLGLEEYRYYRCGNYSVGNRRKLSTAMALIGRPPVVILDEPTSGVDPVARRNLWDVLGDCQTIGQAIILTSHSMDECEALCKRLSILVAGNMVCIGSNQYLKRKFGQGYTIMISIKTAQEIDEQLLMLKQDIRLTFPRCRLQDEHMKLLHYHVKDPTVALSFLFTELERMKDTHDVLEDYTIGDTTLEQVFLSFTKTHKKEKGKDNAT